MFLGCYTEFVSMKEIKCARCGKSLKYNFKSLSKHIKCDHCNLEMIIDSRSQRMLKYVRGLFVAIVVSILMYGCMKLGTIESYVAIIIVCSFTLLLTQFSDQLCLLITDKIFHLRYIAYERPKVKAAKTAKSKRR